MYVMVCLQDRELCDRGIERWLDLGEHGADASDIVARMRIIGTESKEERKAASSLCINLSHPHRYR